MGICTIAYIYFVSDHRLHTNTPMGVSAFAGYMTANPMWWAAFAVCLPLGHAVARTRPGPRILWIALLVIGLIPVGFLALILTTIAKVTLASRVH